MSSEVDHAGNPFLIGGEPGVTPQISGLLGMLRYARKTTLDTVEGLSVADLDHLHDSQSNSIGALLSHIAAVEVFYQVNTFEERGWSDDESERWGIALALGADARSQIKGRPLEFYVEQLSEVRAHTEEELRRRTDDWLAERCPFYGSETNNYWKWFHVCEDEINHRGQIRWLRKRLPD